MFTKFLVYPKFVYKYVLAKFLLIEFKVRLPVKIFEFKQRILDHK